MVTSYVKIVVVFVS